MLLRQCRSRSSTAAATPRGLVAAGALASDAVAAAAAARRAAAAASAALVLIAGPWTDAARADEVTLRFKASPDPQIRAAQQQMVEAWALSSALFVDADAIAKPGWHEGLTRALDASFADGTTPDGVRALEDELLSRLGDPYTRVLRGSAAERLAAEEEGRVVSNGLALLSSSSNAGGSGSGSGSGSRRAAAAKKQQQQQQWAVAYVAPGGPAEAAGVRAGDAVLQVDGAPPPSPASSTRSTREAFLARVSRSPVALRLSRGGGGGAAAAVLLDARLSPAPVDVESVQWGVLRVPSAGPSGGESAAATATTATTPVAYLRIAQFSQRTPAAVAAAMDELFSRAASAGAPSPPPPRPRALLVDLRDDVGGVVEAGVEVARQLLRPGDALAVVTSRAGGPTAAETTSERVVLSPAAAAVAPPPPDNAAAAAAAPALYPSGPASARLPMAVLTTRGTASTAELLAGALRDGGPGATVVGERTYGKGRTQRVVQLQNGVGAGGGAADDDEGPATLLVSTMRFATPSGAPIDGVGLEPGVACSSPAAGFEVFVGGGGGRGDEGAQEAAMRAMLAEDACVRRAAEMLAARATSPSDGT